ncbi:hypothetical protein [Sulfolobus tengchongensis spindle-shaped virus 4]|nr:hypothetical protein [Sulfolobus tengchongensis spindle-shaped virus 4]
MLKLSTCFSSSFISSFLFFISSCLFAVTSICRFLFNSVYKLFANCINFFHTFTSLSL